MNSNFFIQLKKIFKSEKIKTNKKVFIFLFFLFLSTLFWFLNALNEEYRTSLNYPVRYINYPNDKVLVNEPVSKLKLKVQSYGYTLLRYKLNPALMPIAIDVGANASEASTLGDSSNYYIITNLIKEKISNQVSSQMEILTIKPDSLIFNFSEIINKTLPIKPNIKVIPSNQYMLKSPIYTKPDSVTAKGPENILDTLKAIKTQRYTYKEVTEEIQKTIPLQSHKKISYSENSVQVTIPVEQFTEAQIKIPIEPFRFPDSLILKTFPERVTVSYNVALSDYERVNSDMFRAVIDFGEIDIREISQAPVKLMRAPDYVKNIHYYPQNVEFIIEK